MAFERKFKDGETVQVEYPKGHVFKGTVITYVQYWGYKVKNSTTGCSQTYEVKYLSKVSTTSDSYQTTKSGAKIPTGYRAAELKDLKIGSKVRINPYMTAGMHTEYCEFYVNSEMTKYAGKEVTIDKIWSGTEKISISELPHYVFSPRSFIITLDRIPEGYHVAEKGEIKQGETYIVRPDLQLGQKMCSYTVVESMLAYRGQAVRIKGVDSDGRCITIAPDTWCSWSPSCFIVKDPESVVAKDTLSALISDDALTSEISSDIGLAVPTGGIKADSGEITSEKQGLLPQIVYETVTCTDTITVPVLGESVGRGLRDIF